jgi:Mg2+/Co2+ transporter CorB
MKTLANAGDKRAALVLRITDQKSKMLSAILIGNNIVNLSASSLATSMAIKAFGSFGAGIATGILTFLILIFGEITPKNAATLRSNDIARRDARFIWSLMYILTPVIFIVNSISIFILRLRGVKNEESGDALTNDEIRTLVDYSEEKGTIE